MNKETYLAGGYPVGSSKYRIAKKKYGAIAAPEAVEIEKTVAPKKKTTKKVAKKKSED